MIINLIWRVFENELKKICKIKIENNKIKENKTLIGKNTEIRKAIFEGQNLLEENIKFNKSYLGFGSTINSNSDLENVKIGKYTSIGPGANIASGNHPTKTYVTTHPFAYTNKGKNIGMNFIKKQIFNTETNVPNSEFSLKIGNDVWIGKNATFLSGVQIGDGAIIAAGAVVVKDVEPFSIVGGVPAKEIRKRFTKEEILFLMEFKWWDKPLEWIKENVELFSDIKKFMYIYKKS